MPDGQESLLAAFEANASEEFAYTLFLSPLTLFPVIRQPHFLTDQLVAGLADVFVPIRTLRVFVVVRQWLTLSALVAYFCLLHSSSPICASKNQRRPARLATGGASAKRESVTLLIPCRRLPPSGP